MFLKHFLLVLKAIEIKETIQCRKCSSQMRLTEEKKKEEATCSCCKKIFCFKNDYLECPSEECREILCRICRFQINQNQNQCYFCTKNIRNVENERNKLNCSLCLKEFGKKQIFSFKNRNNSKICITCSENMQLSLHTDLLIENQRFWKGKWLDCPILPLGILILPI